MLYTRRHLGKLALAALPATLLAKPDSKWGGVQIGINVPYSYRGLPGDADHILEYTTGLGLSAVELRSQPVEAYFGAPNSSRIGTPRATTDAEKAAQAAGAEALEKWRLAASIDKFKEFRKKYEDAGIAIQIVKFDGVDKMKDAVVDYAFGLAKALGAHALSCEIPLSKTKWLGEFATKHKMMVGYHGHDATNDPNQTATLESYDTLMAYGGYNGINLDIGHFTAANYDAVAFIKQHHDRITNLHIKDRKKDHGPNVAEWGTGDTPIKAVLQLLKTEKYPIPANMELEYRIPDGSDIVAEAKKCFAYVKSCLA